MTHTHEARRWCSGDGGVWTEWQPCTAAQADEYRKDESFCVRPITTPKTAPIQHLSSIDEGKERREFEKWLSGFPSPPPLTSTAALVAWDAWMRRATLSTPAGGMEVVGEIFMLETLHFDDQKEISHAHLFRELPNKTKLYAYTKPAK